MKHTYYSASANETLAIARRLAPRLRRGGVVWLVGGLGSGKTTFVKGLARQVGVRQTIQSPTFVLCRDYRIRRGPLQRLVHIDAYRLARRADLLELGWAEMVDETGTLVLVENPGRAGRGLHPDAIIRFDVLGGSDRRRIRWESQHRRPQRRSRATV